LRSTSTEISVCVRSNQPSNLKSVDPTLVTIPRALSSSAPDLDLINSLNHCTSRVPLGPRAGPTPLYTPTCVLYPAVKDFPWAFDQRRLLIYLVLTRWCRRVMVPSRHCRCTIAAAATITTIDPTPRPSTPHILHHTSKICVRWQGPIQQISDPRSDHLRWDVRSPLQYSLAILVAR
jgi:hypothetical protein